MQQMMMTYMMAMNPAMRAMGGQVPGAPGPQQMMSPQMPQQNMMMNPQQQQAMHQ